MLSCNKFFLLYLVSLVFLHFQVQSSATDADPENLKVSSMVSN